MRARHVLLFLLSLCCLWSCAPATGPCQSPCAGSDQDADPGRTARLAAVEAAWGIQPVGWYVYDHGRRSELRYRVVDAARAQAALDRLVWPTLMREDDGDQYTLVNPLKPGNLLLLRAGQAKTGQLFYLRLSHQPFQLSPGQHVTLVLAADTRRLGNQSGATSVSDQQAAGSDPFQDQELRLPCMTVEDLP